MERLSTQKNQKIGKDLSIFPDIADYRTNKNLREGSTLMSGKSNRDGSK